MPFIKLHKVLNVFIFKTNGFFSLIGIKMGYLFYFIFFNQPSIALRLSCLGYEVQKNKKSILAIVACTKSMMFNRKQRVFNIEANCSSEKTQTLRHTERWPLQSPINPRFAVTVPRVYPLESSQCHQNQLISFCLQRECPHHFCFVFFCSYDYWVRRNTYYRSGRKVTASLKSIGFSWERECVLCFFLYICWSQINNQWSKVKTYCIFLFLL